MVPAILKNPYEKAEARQINGGEIRRCECTTFTREAEGIDVVLDVDVDRTDTSGDAWNLRAHGALVSALQVRDCFCNLVKHSSSRI